jgi:hypothetical protein
LFYILRDEVEDSLPLPRGEREVPLVIADRTFNEDGSLYYPSIDPSLPKSACAACARRRVERQ